MTRRDYLIDWVLAVLAGCFFLLAAFGAFIDVVLDAVLPKKRRMKL